MGFLIFIMSEIELEMTYKMHFWTSKISKFFWGSPP